MSLLTDNNLSILLSEVLGEGKNIKKDELIFHCLFCKHHKPKLQINLQNHKWNCWVCGKKGRSIYALFKKLNASKSQFYKLNQIVPSGYVCSTQPINNTGEVPLTLPSEFIPLYKPSPSLLVRHAIKYCKNRNLSTQDFIKYNIGFCEEGLYKNRLILSSYDSNGELNFFTGRNIFEGNGVNYKNCISSKDIIGLDVFVNWDIGEITLCEGMFDAFAIKRNVIPLFGKTLSNKLKNKLIDKKIKKVNVCLDMDAKTDIIKICKQLEGLGIDTYIVELGGKDPSSMGFNQMCKAIKESKKYSFDLIFKNGWIFD